MAMLYDALTVTRGELSKDRAVARINLVSNTKSSGTLSSISQTIAKNLSKRAAEFGIVVLNL